MIDDFRKALWHFERHFDLTSRDENISPAMAMANRQSAEQIKKIQAKMGTLLYVNRIIKLMKLRFITYVDLPSIFDTNGYLTNCKNCVIEVIDDDARLKDEPACRTRVIKPEDFLTMNTNVHVNENYTWESKDVKEVLNYMGRVFTDPEVCNFVIRLDSSLLQAGNRDKILTTRVGRGNNSKSGHQRLISLTFGDYAKDVGTSILTGRDDRRANEHTEEEASLRNARAAITCEPRSGERLNTAKAKMATGNDRKYVRGMNEKGMIIEQSYKIYIFANNQMRVTEVDMAIKKRLLVIFYESVWSENAPVDEKEQYKMRHFPSNLDFDKKLKKYPGAYLWILMQYFHDYKATKYLVIPEKVRKDTEKYWQENDTYNVFITQRMIRVTDDKSVASGDVWNEFSVWYNGCKYDKDLQPDQQRMIENMEYRLGNLVAGRWMGWQLNRAAHGAPQQTRPVTVFQLPPVPLPQTAPVALEVKFDHNGKAHPPPVQPQGIAQAESTISVKELPFTPNNQTPSHILNIAPLSDKNQMSVQV